MAEVEATSRAGVGQQALRVVERGRRHLDAMPPQRRNSLFASGLLLVALIAAAAWWINRPDWRVLYSGLEARDASTVEQELGAAGIAFRTSADQSGIEVPVETLDKARMEVATKGMPQTGRLGFELFDKPNWVGSEFDEKVNYQRALEGELEHTIGSLGEVKQARVHLVLPEESLFSQREKPAKASVVLKLRRPSLTSEQVESVRRLVAGAVPNLAVENVTLVDSEGRQDFSSKDRDGQQRDSGQELETRLVAMLEPMVGPGNVRAVANVSYDEGSEERTDEVYDPALTATLSSEKTQQTSENAVKAQGVPGTASNTPAAAPVGAVQGSAQAAAPGVPPLLQAPGGKQALPVYPQAAGGIQTVSQENGTFAVTKHTLHREDGPGRLRKVTVAVVVNDRMALEGEGKLAHSVWKPRSSEEMHRLEELAQAAVGFDPKRGDSVVVQNIGFTSNIAGEADPLGAAKVVEQARSLIASQPGALRIGLTGFLGVLVVMLVLRPVSRQMVASLKQPTIEETRLALATRAGTAGLGEGGATRGALSEQAGGKPEGTSSRPVVERVGEYIRQKPMESTRMLENWISQGEDK